MNKTFFKNNKKIKIIEIFNKPMSEILKKNAFE